MDWKIVYVAYVGSYSKEWYVEHFSSQPRLLTTLKKKAFENIVGKVENAGNQHFLLYLQCFPRHQT